MIDPRALLRAQGVRATAPRLLLLDLLGAAGHLTADELIERAAAADPPVHRATVYRTLDGLTAAGVLRHTHLSVGPPAYSVEGEELFVQCTGCGRLAALPASVWAQLPERVHAATGFALDPTHVALSGRCPDCAGVAVHPHR